MYTLKFISRFDSLGSNHKSATFYVHCKSFMVNEFENRFDIIAYEGMTTTDGVEFHLMTDEQFEEVKDHPDAPNRYFKICYVENVNGDTINVLDPNNL